MLVMLGMLMEAMIDDASLFLVPLLPVGVADLAQRAVTWCVMCDRRRGGVGGGRISRFVSSNGRAPPAGRSRVSAWVGERESFPGRQWVAGER